MDASQVYNQWKNRIVLDSGGEKLGSIEDVYLDRVTQQPEWGLVSMGLFGTRHLLVPLGDAKVEGNRVQLPYDAERVRTAPAFDPQGELSEEQEQRLYRHYGTAAPGALRDSSSSPASESSAPPTGPARLAQAGPPRQPAGGTIELREEQLDVRKQPAQVGEVRLRKEIVTERRELEVPVLRELVVLERRTVRRRPTQPTEIGEASEVVIALTREQVELIKQPIVREEVAVTKTAVEETERVSADVRREVPHLERTGDVRVAGDVPQHAESTTS